MHRLWPGWRRPVRRGQRARFGFWPGLRPAHLRDAQSRDGSVCLATHPSAAPALGPVVAIGCEHLLVTPGRALEAVKRALPERQEAPQWSALPYFDHEGFDQMLWACDLKFVRAARGRLLSQPDLLTNLLAATNRTA